MRKEIGKRITIVRNNLGLKKNEFAKLLEITPQYLSTIEAGTNCLSVEKLILLANKTNISLDYILLGKQNSFDKNIIKELINIDDKQIDFSLNTIKEIVNLLKLRN